MVDVGQLYRQTEGNPFYVTEVLANPGGGIPINVREAVLARAARLSGAGYAVLEAAAIIGRRVAPWLLTAVAGEQAHAAEECMAVGMLVAQEDELAFRHDLAHSTILEAISLPRKQALHRLVLDALKSTPVGRSNLARLAHHAEGAGDREAVLVFAPNAARIASENDAHRAAAALYSLALRYAEDLPPGERAQLLEQHGRACEFIQEQPEAIDSYRTAAELWHQDGNRLKYGYLLSRQASVLSMAGDRDEAGEIIDRAIAVLESLPRGPELAYAYRNKALHHTYLGENPQAIAMADKTLALAKQLGDAYLSILAREAVGMCWLAVDHARGLEYLEETLSLALDNQIEGRVGALYGNMSMAYVDVYHFDRAERLIAEGIAYATERDLDTVRFFMRTWQAIAHFYQGRWDKASEGIDEVLRRPGLASISRIPALAVLGRLRARRGDPGSEDALDEALKIATWRRNFQRSGVVRTARAEAAWLAGQHEGTLEEARAAYDMTLNNKQAGFAAELAFWQWRAGEPVETYDWMLQAYTLHIAGDWQAAAEEWAHLGCPYEQARALADGDTSAQLKALEIFERLGARTDSENLRDKLRAADAVGIPQQPRAATLENPFHLTNRQVEVLKLLIEGLSNAEIAARLHISPKTAEHHVSAVLAKLNVSSRKDAAELGKSSKAF
jgi:DNA-binding CsgD family transcriptional regulator